MEMSATDSGRAGRLIGEDELRQISRSIRSHVPQGTSQADGNDDQLNRFRTLLDDAFFTSSFSGLGAAHRVAAWNTLCSLIDQAVESRHPKVKEYIWTHDVWNRAFHLYLSHAQSARPKSSRQLMATLTTALVKAPGTNSERCKGTAAMELIKCLRDYEAPAKAKASAQFLSHLLLKDTLDLDEFLKQVSDIGSSNTGNARTSQIEAMLETSFRWLGRGDFGSTIAQLVSTVLDKSLATRGIQHSESGGNTPIWMKPLERALLSEAADADALRAHIFPALFKRSFADFVSFLYLQGLDDILGQGRQENAASGLNEPLLFGALQTGKELGLIHETDEPGVLNDGTVLHLPVAAIGRLLLRSSREARLTGLTLLISSQTTTRVFSASAIGLIKNALRICVADVDADFRSDIFSAIQRLVDRIRAITAAASRQQAANKTLDGQSPVKVLASHKGFLEWFLRFLAQDLRPTASYQRHISALKCLQIIARSGLDESVPQKNWSRTALGETKWPFHMTIMSLPLQQLLLDLLMDPFDDVRQSSSSILVLFSSTLSLDLLEENSDGGSALERAEAAMLNTGRADHADGVAHIYAIWHRTQTSVPSSDHDRSLGEGTLFDLMEKLEQMIAVAREDLAEAVAKYPMHGLLTSIRYVLESRNLEDFGAVGHRLHGYLKEIWELVKPVLCNDAPEGYQPEEIDMSADSTKETLSYCWRALKEASLVLNVLINDRQRLEQKSLVEDMSSLCFTQLAELRHRGAFSTVAQTWVSCCTQCADLRSTSGESLLNQWYEKALDMLRRNITINTRRSAGLPSLLCGILIAQKSNTTFDQAFKDLESISRQKVDIALAEEGNLPQVHAMNCIKDVLKNTKLGERSERYVPVALQLAADALRSEVWAIRNCGLMLFRAVIDRLLGTDQSHFENEVVSQKSISAEEYPELLDVILGLLPQSDLSDTGLNERNEGVFPALRLLQHTRVPQARLDNVKTAVMVLTASPSWHVRDKASRAMASLLSLEDPLTATNEYQTIAQSSQPRQNEVHGILLTAQYFIRALRRNHSSSNGARNVPDMAMHHECEAIMRFSSARLLTNEDRHTVRAACVDVIWECGALLHAIADGPHRTGTEPSRAGREHSAAPIAQLDNFAELLSITAHDPSAAVFRQAVVRFIAQQISYGVWETEQDLEATLQMLLQVAETDKNACEYFFHAFKAGELAIDARTAGFIIRFAVVILAGDFDVVLKCVAQEAILRLFAQGQHLTLNLPTSSPESQHHLAANWCNQRFADNHIQLQALQLDRCATQQEHVDETTLQQIESWSDNCVRAVNDKGVFTREAAAAAIDRIQRLWKVMSATDKLQECFLRLCIAVYDLLNDDDEDIRLLASAATSRILSTTSGDEMATYEPIISSQKLLGFCVARWSKDENLASIAFERAFGMEQAALVPVAEQLAALSRSDTALFAQEKQNLYIDHAQEVRVWSKLIQKLSAEALPSDALTNLSSWIVEGLDTLKLHAQKNKDGSLGWSSKSEIFTLGLRVIYGAETLFALVQKTGRLPVQPSALRSAVFECLTTFEAAGVSPLWLWEMQRVLTESVSVKTKLVGAFGALQI